MERTFTGKVLGRVAYDIMAIRFMYVSRVMI
jgi:hypothetical protein